MTHPLLDQYVDGSVKFQKVVEQLNIDYHWSSFTNVDGLIKQLESSNHHDWFTLFYMVNEFSPEMGGNYFQIHKERFEKISPKQ